MVAVRAGRNVPVTRQPYGAAVMLRGTAIHCEHEWAAAAAIQQARTTESFVIGTIDEKELEALRARGLIGDELPQAGQGLNPVVPHAVAGVGVEQLSNDFAG